MRTTELKIARIGNSRGVRIPAEVLRRYDFGDAAILVECVEGLLLRPKQKTDEKLSWADTAKAMEATTEDWSDWDAAASDGLEGIPWRTAQVAERRSVYGTKQKSSQRRRT